MDTLKKSANNKSDLQITMGLNPCRWWENHIMYFSWTTFKFTGRSYLHELTQANFFLKIVHLVASFEICVHSEMYQAYLGFTVLTLLFRQCCLALFFYTYHITWSFILVFWLGWRMLVLLPTKNKSILLFFSIILWFCLTTHLKDF